MSHFIQGVSIGIGVVLFALYFGARTKLKPQLSKFAPLLGVVESVLLDVERDIEAQVLAALQDGKITRDEAIAIAKTALTAARESVRKRVTAA